MVVNLVVEVRPRRESARGTDEPRYFIAVFYLFIYLFFSGKVKRERVKWAGNPYEKCIQEGTEGYLEPRKSFKAWSETVAGKCREWTEQEIEEAAVLCLVYKSGGSRKRLCRLARADTSDVLMQGSVYIIVEASPRLWSSFSWPQV